MKRKNAFRKKLKGQWPKTFSINFCIEVKTAYSCSSRVENVIFVGSTQSAFRLCDYGHRNKENSRGKSFFLRLTLLFAVNCQLCWKSPSIKLNEFFLWKQFIFHFILHSTVNSSGTQNLVLLRLLVTYSWMLQRRNRGRIS